MQEHEMAWQFRFGTEQQVPAAELPSHQVTSDIFFVNTRCSILSGKFKFWMEDKEVDSEQYRSVLFCT
ncbi:MAG: hypothetical protein HZA77_07400 [Candidatus Schekmanbacteria bacterium]|nr:hypothetical protein [Candidatus Schekmanbacteria bacterium]